MKTQSTLTAATKPSANPQTKKVPAEAEFAGALAQAGAPAQQPLAQTITTNTQTLAQPQEQVKAALQEQAKAATQQVAAQQQQQPAGKPLTGAEKSALTQKPAASLNTAAANTGLQPWSKEWVFGNQLQEQTSEAPAENAQSAQMAAQSLSAQALVQQQQPQAQQQAPVQFGTQAEPQGQKAPSAQAAQAKAQTAGKTAQKDVLSRVPPAYEAALAPAQFALPMQGMQQLASAKPDTRPARGEARAVQNAKGNPAQAAAAQAGAAAAGDLTMSQLASQLEQLDGEIQEVDASEGPQKPVSKAAPKHSNLSGSEFLDTLKTVKRDLKVIEGGKPTIEPARAEVFGESAQLTAKPRLIRGGAAGEEFQAMAAGMAAPNREQAPAPATIVTGHVTSGAMSQDRLSTEALNNVTLGIKNLGSNGGGEIRVRLKPENLGELHVRVVTSGKEVGLQIQATDEKAKKILEESMSSLKESLATQNLTLGKVDLMVASAASSFDAGTRDQQQPQQQPQHQAFSGLMNQDARQGNQGRGQWNEGGNDFAQRNSVGGGAQASSAIAGAAAPRRAAGMGSSRLDVMA